jgi:transcriptional regulatory protein RtcR
MKRVVIGLLGSVLDRGARGPKRWDKWRPTVDLCRHPDLLIDRLELVYQTGNRELADEVAGDIAHVSPETEVRLHQVSWDDAWDFEEVFAGLHELSRSYRFDVDREDYLIHITTGTHVAQICLFLLTESRHFPARLLQTAPPKKRGEVGSFSIIDLDLSRYDRLAQRFADEQSESLAFLKSGIATRNRAFNDLIAEIETVAIRSTEPILLTGPTGAGKSQLARKIYELRVHRRQVAGPFVEVNCATLRGDGAMSALFGHVKGAYTGATRDRPGLLKSADGGILFLDEIGELGIDEQAVLLRAVEDGVFLPVGADREVASRFQLIAGTNRDLAAEVARGRFREDLLARINLWSFRLPGIAERPEDIEPNLDYELAQWTRRRGTRVTFNRDARRDFLAFATSPAARWPGNFRDFNAALTRMATLATGGRITRAVVAGEIARLRAAWRAHEPARPGALARVNQLLGADRAGELDRFDAVQLEEVLATCAASESLSAAGRALFAASRARKRNPNDADRLRKYLARYGLRFSDARGPFV